MIYSLLDVAECVTKLQTKILEYSEAATKFSKKFLEH
jgi:hypothetical protein